MPATGKIVILTGASLAWNPRARKEATALASAGYEVTVLGAAPSRGQFEIDQQLASQAGFNFRSIISYNDQGARRDLGMRLRSRMASLLFKWFRLESPFQLNHLTLALWQSARKEPADYYSAHLEPAMWVGRRLIGEDRTVGIDMEDWYSEDLLPEARRHRPIKLLRSLESALLRNGAQGFCPSLALGEALAREYECPPPTVIYNAFPWAERETLDGRYKDRKSQTAPSIHWYSQTLGKGRGLEDLLAALPFLKHEVEIHLRGKPVVGFDDWLASLVPEPLRNRIYIHDLVSNEELLSRIAEHDIGFAGEMKYSRSRDLTVTNKILHYLLAGLAVVASDTAGQREVAEQAGGAVFIYRSGGHEELATQLNCLLGNPDLLAKTKSLALDAARKTFCWERVAPVLVDKIGRGINSGNKSKDS